jgi:DNA-binding NarL/FixJ family response regulator
MEATAAASETNTAGLLTDAMVHIVSQKSLNTELLVDFMAEELEFTCQFSSDHSLAAALNQFPDRTHLTFLDCSGGKKLTFLKLPHLKKAHQHPRCHFILYNIDLAHCLEMDALRLGIRGILYAHQPIEFFPRAARAVLNGELWYTRNILAQFIIEKGNGSVPTAEACVVLTQREKEIVTKLAEGCSNRDIARHFRISPHTVKTHAYNIYKKINVDNRLQASLWLANSS